MSREAMSKPGDGVARRASKREAASLDDIESHREKPRHHRQAPAVTKPLKSPGNARPLGEHRGTYRRAPALKRAVLANIMKANRPIS